MNVHILISFPHSVSLGWMDATTHTHTRARERVCVFLGEGRTKEKIESHLPPMGPRYVSWSLPYFVVTANPFINN